MNHTASLILTALMLISIMLFWVPSVMAMNRGRMLQTIALWLAIFLGLALVYKTFGPESEHPLFHFPTGLMRSPTLIEDENKDRG